MFNDGREVSLGIADRIPNHGRFMSIGAFAAVVSFINIFLGIVQEPLALAIITANTKAGRGGPGQQSATTP